MKSSKHSAEKQPELIQRLIRPFQSFAHAEGTSGIVLILCTVVALVWANSPWAASYTELWETHLTIGIGEYALSKSLLHWIDDGLMSVFFFLVGLEIKREVIVGELASFKQAALPIAAAIGGMVVPALIFVGLNAEGEGAHGWGIPMATDIAFALGILALLGKRIPAALTVFLAALAIADDIGAVLVIAIFYTEQLSIAALGIGILFFAGSIAANWSGVRNPVVYAMIGVAMWIAFMYSGVHATIAGVMMAFTIPARQRINLKEFLDKGDNLLSRLRNIGNRDSAFASAEQLSVLQTLEDSCEHVMTPLQRLEHGLEYWVAFLVMPVFALANAGVAIGGDLLGTLSHPVSLGIILGLVVGKQIGITLFAWIAVKTGMATMPAGVTWRHVYGAAWLGGIGFTMSLFITGLAFDGLALLPISKIAILAASIVAGFVGWLILRRTPPVVAAAAS